MKIAHACLLLLIVTLILFQATLPAERDSALVTLRGQVTPH